jgi:hypothetical protein
LTVPQPGSELPAAVQRQAYAVIAGWRQAPAATLTCPRCGSVDGVTITDRSARPFAEWYQIACPGCGLDHTFQVPISRAGSDG